MKTIKWLLGLEKGQLIIALLIIATTALFLQNQVKEQQKDALNTSFRDELIRRDDSCQSGKIKIMQEANKRVEEFMRTILDRSRKTEKAVDSTVKHNSKLIDDVKKAKKLLHNDNIRTSKSLPADFNGYTTSYTLVTQP